MSKNQRDFVTITHTINSPDVKIARSTSPRVRHLRLRAFVRMLGQLSVQVTDVPQPKVGATRFIITNSTTKVWCVEVPPGVYSISDETYVGGAKMIVRRRISLPWTYMIIRNRDSTCLVYCRSAQVKGIDDSLCVSPLPNVSRGNLCLGDNRFEGRVDPNESRIDWSLRLLFDAPFVHAGYMTDAILCRERVRGIPKTLLEWEAMTVGNPNFAEALIWPEAGISVRNAMLSLAGNQEIRESFVTALLVEGEDGS